MNMATSTKAERIVSWKKNNEKEINYWRWVHWWLQQQPVPHDLGVVGQKRARSSPRWYMCDHEIRWRWRCTQLTQSDMSRPHCDQTGTSWELAAAGVDLYQTPTHSPPVNQQIHLTRTSHDCLSSLTRTGLVSQFYCAADQRPNLPEILEQS